MCISVLREYIANLWRLLFIDCQCWDSLRTLLAIHPITEPASAHASSSRQIACAPLQLLFIWASQLKAGRYLHIAWIESNDQVEGERRESWMQYCRLVDLWAGVGGRFNYKLIKYWSKYFWCWPGTWNWNLIKILLGQGSNAVPKTVQSVSNIKYSTQSLLQSTTSSSSSSAHKYSTHVLAGGKRLRPCLERLSSSQAISFQTSNAIGRGFVTAPQLAAVSFVNTSYTGYVYLHKD